MHSLGPRILPQSRGIVHQMWSLLEGTTDPLAGTVPPRRLLVSVAAMLNRQVSLGSPSAAVGELDHRHLWHPFTAQRDWCREQPLVIERGEGTELVDSDGRRYIDGVSSLWFNVHGHRHPLIDQAIREQLDRVAHSTMLGLTHRGAVELAARLVELAPPGLGRVFYSDSGSSAAEIALKMAFQYWQQRGGQHVRRTSFVCLRGAYHGDTL